MCVIGGMTRSDLAPAIGRLFAHQDGLVTPRQLDAVGATRAYVRTRLANGEWTRLSSNVIGTATAPDSWRRRVRAAWFEAGPGTAVSHVTGTRVHAFDGCLREEELHCIAFDARHRTASPEVTIHRTTLLRASDCPIVDGIRVVPRPVALVQLAATRGTDRAGQALDGMLRHGDSPIWIGRLARSWLRPGTTGARTVLELLDKRVNGRLPRSWFQRLAKEVLDTRGIALVDEHPVMDPQTGRTLAQLDLADPDLQIGVECQSWEWHGTPTAQAADARRRRRLRVLGWEIVDVWWTDLHSMDEVVGEIHFLIDQRPPRASKP